MIGRNCIDLILDVSKKGVANKIKIAGYMRIAIFHLHKHPYTDKEWSQHGAASDNSYQSFWQMFPPKPIDKKTYQRQQRNQINQV